MKRLLKNQWAVPILILAGVGLIAALLIVQLVNQPRDPKIECLSRLSNIGLLSQFYSAAHNDQLPTNVASLLAYWPGFSHREYRRNLRFLLCPATHHTAGKKAEADHWTDFVMFTNVARSSPSRMPLMYCPPRNHAGIGGNILFTDGSVEWYDANEFSNVLSQQSWEIPKGRP